MKKNSLTFILSFVFCLLPFSAQANWQSLSAEDFPLAAAPARGSLSERQDVQTLLQWQQGRTQAQCALARSQMSPGFISFYGPRAGLFSRQELQQLTPLMDKISKLTVKVTEVYKRENMRPRPYNSYPQIKPCIPPPGGSKSYPSSHASVATAQACVLAAIFPDRADQILQYGASLADLRAVVGVHYPQDVQAGKDLGNEICQTLLAQPDFQKEMP